jgi:hypothetical protein
MIRQIVDEKCRFGLDYVGARSVMHLQFVLLALAVALTTTACASSSTRSDAAAEDAVAAKAAQAITRPQTIAQALPPGWFYSTAGLQPPGSNVGSIRPFMRYGGR